MMRVLLTEDDHRLSDSIRRGLRDVGIEAVVADTAAAARERIVFATHDVIVLDVTLPDGNGFELCAFARARCVATPILMLTARDAVGDRVRGLEHGADDYLTKPFAFPELVARIRALGRRGNQLLAERVRIADMDVDLVARQVTRGGQSIALTVKEFALLEFFIRNTNAVVDRASITSKVWDENHDPTSNTLEVLVSRLRAKIDDAYEQKLIHTMRGAGYRFGLDD
ncbi:heavy metal response regulator transcription factor [soil metagenome]